MCHSIIWIHVLCGHPDPSLTSLIFCDDTFFTGHDCLPCIGASWLPLKGLCRSCKNEKRRSIKLKRARVVEDDIAYAGTNQQDAWEWGSTASTIMSATKKRLRTKSQTHVQNWECRIRYDGWDEEDEETIEHQTQPCGLGLLNTAPTGGTIEQWLDYPESPVFEDPGLSGLEDHLPQPEYTTKPRKQRSYIPVPVRMIQKRHQTTREGTPRLIADEGDEEESLVDEMELFDRITF